MEIWNDDDLHSKKSKHHWGFLEEIEAPMWVDLNVEANCYTEDKKDEDWFQVSHWFHQRSARQLKSMFSSFGIGEGSTITEFDVGGTSSPKLPPSVSRSRGNEYKSKKWGGEHKDALLKKKQPVKVSKGKFTSMESGFNRKPSFINPRGSSSSNKSSVIGGSLAGKNAASNGSGSSSMGGQISRSNTTSTVTSKSNGQQREQHKEVSSQEFGQTSSLLSSLRISLRKSCGTRQALRSQVHNDIKPSDAENGRRHSSSGKSSVGSSSHPGYDPKGWLRMLAQGKERVPNSSNVARRIETAKAKIKLPNVSLSSAAQFNEGTSYLKQSNTVTTSGYLNTAKPKRNIMNLEETNILLKKTQAPSQKIHTKPLLRPQVNEQNSFTGGTKLVEKLRASRFNRPLAAGKENATISAPLKCSSRKKVTGGMIWSPKGTKRNDLQRRDKRTLVGPKEKIRYRSNDEGTTVKPKPAFR